MSAAHTSAAHTAYLVIEIGLVIPSGLAIAYGMWKLNLWAWRDLKRQRHAPWNVQARRWKPTGAQVAPTHQIKVLTALAVGVTWLVIFGLVTFLLLH